MNEIKAYGESRSLTHLVRDVDSLLNDQEKRFHDLMWETTYSAPHCYAGLLDIRFLVIKNTHYIDSHAAAVLEAVSRFGFDVHGSRF